ncbi:MAG: hypothetical protein KJ063_02580 [Anaerolineae bacterium]|nr:hypothetical protein [Anaerolineae bacterium]
MKQQFVEMRFRSDTLAAIGTANSIINQYRQQGYQLTLRQLYYQHVARGLIENTERSYKRLGEMISNGRLAGLIDWGAIEDRTRNLRGVTHWSNPAQIINATYRSFRMDKWDGQPNRIEVWVEKDALVGVLERVCTRHDVDYFSCRGYVSQSEMYEAARRLARYLGRGQAVTVLHLGDHDPSGMDMTRDIRERLTLFLEGMGIHVNRLALNWDQIEQYNPPPNPAKATDARFEGYAAKFGYESWELDALEPAVIESLIERHILRLRDDALWQKSVNEEETHRDLLLRTSNQWPGVVEYLEGA